MLSRTKKIERDKRTDRINKSKVALNTLIKENKSKPIDELYKTSETLYQKKNKTILEKIELKAIKSIIDEKNTMEGIEDKSEFKAYPSIYDPDFNKKIFSKKEFNINKLNPLDETLDLDEQADKMCKFNLSNNQKFLKTYISSETPYNGLLLFHGTGVGKTCSSISIAENFKEVLMETNKKITILLNPSIKDNFIKNIFNIEKLKQGKVEEQCTKDSYIKEANINIKGNPGVINSKIMKIINNRYNFLGYGAFSNLIESIENKYSEKYDDEEIIERLFEKEINDRFSNSVMIIDEVHNVKESSDDKILPKLLRRVLQIVENMKLILLSATPMFDKPTEIVDILNLLLSNDKRTLIETSQVFSKGNLTEEGKVILVNKSKGYISYLRGEHPLKFPKRLYPDIFEETKFESLVPIITKVPIRDVNNEEIVKANRLSLLKIVNCPMTGYQLRKYNNINLASSEDDLGAFNQRGLMASNIIFPSDDADADIATIISDRGFSKVAKKGKNTYSINSKYPDFFDLKNLKKYSSKITKIVKNIESSEGIIFIYSQFLSSGVSSIALALESNGYSKYKGSLLSKSRDQQEKEKKYIIISGDDEVSKDAYSNYLKIENENMNGEKVKVIIGSSTAAEGLDFKYIREVHVLEPWYHFNKIEQVIGRGIRNCSHKDLPKEKRNVIVYLYGATLSKDPSKDIETIDLKLYRMSEKKMKQIADVEYLLKMNAVDCNLNIEENAFTADYYKKPVEIITSKGTVHNINLRDIDNSKQCNFQKCDYKCMPDLSNLQSREINFDTFSVHKARDNIFDIKLLLKNLFKTQPIYTIDELEDEYVKYYDTKDKFLLYYSLTDLIDNKDLFSDVNGKLGVVIQQGGYYIFTQEYLSNQFVSIDDIYRPNSNKIRLIDITDLKAVDKEAEDDASRLITIKKIVNYIIRIENEEKRPLLKDKNFSKANKEELTAMFNELLSYNNFIYDILTPNYKQEILNYILKRSNSRNPLNETEEEIKKGLQKNLLTMKDVNVMYDKENYVWGYKILLEERIKYFKFDPKKRDIVEANSSETKSIQKNINRKIREEPESSIIIGYLEYKASSNSVNLKIRDKSKEGKKGTQIKTGSVCGNDGMKKNTIINFIEQTIEGKYESDKIPGKPNLCLELELRLRKHDFNKTNKLRWFYNLEESFERDLNKKVY